MSQTVFKFAVAHDYSPENFIVSSANCEAFEYIRKFPWPFYAVNIHGPAGSGKTYLANLLANESSAGIIDGVDASVDERELLHHLNSVKEANGFILITSRQPLTALGFALPDLTSRLAAIPAIRLGEPDTELLHQLFARNFSARQLKITDDVITYLAARVERNFQAAQDAVDKLDRLSLEQKRNITIPLVRDILTNAA